MSIDIANAVRPEFPAVAGNPGNKYIFADAPTGTQVKNKPLRSIIKFGVICHHLNTPKYFHYTTFFLY